MSDYTVARIDEIDELSDGRCPFRPVRMHFGIMSFGVNTWTGKSAGDRIINEHDEADEHEELYLVQQGRATFELDGERVDAPAGTIVFARPGRQAYGLRRGRGHDDRRDRGHAGRGLRALRVRGLAADQRRSTRPASTPEAADRGRELIEAASPVRGPALQRGVLREPGRADGRCDRAPARRDQAIRAVPDRSRPGTRISIRSASSRSSRSWWASQYR